MKRTPLYDSHVALGAKLIEFGGWEMPVHYGAGIIKEHVNTRKNVGVFDIAHMGEFLVQGENATEFLQYVMSNDLSLMADGKGQYACMCFEHGGTIDDCFYYRYNPEKYRIIFNAANIEKNWEWLKRHGKQFGVVIQNLSEMRGRLALQGPKAQATLVKISDIDLPSLPRFHFTEGNVNSIESFVSRTGYTGEDGFEMSFPITEINRIWGAIMDAGIEYSLLPVGLGARNTLRLEACYSLYGHELNADISPVEAGIGWAVKAKDVPFIGKPTLLAQKGSGTTRMIKPVEVMGRGIIRAGYEVYRGKHKVGYVTSGTYSPCLKKGIGLAIISSDLARAGTEMEVDVRGKRVTVKVRKDPFVVYSGPAK